MKKGCISDSHFLTAKLLKNSYWSVGLSVKSIKYFVDSYNFVFSFFEVFNIYFKTAS